MRRLYPLIMFMTCTVPISAAVGQGQTDQQQVGAKVYGDVCAACHATGVVGAPVLTEKAAWLPRIEKGKATLYTHAISGFRAMPAKGGQASLTDAQVKAAVDYIIATVTGGGAVATGPKIPNAVQLLDTPVTDLQISPSKDIKNPYAGNIGAIGRGKSLFTTMNCVGCHAPKAGGGMGPPLSDNVWIYGDKPADIYLTIAQGRPNGMPAWGGKLPPQAIWSLVTYIRTLSK